MSNHNTLHLCHLDVVENPQWYLTLMVSDDAVIFYGTSIDEQQKRNLVEQFQPFDHYFIFDQSLHSTLDYHGWVELVDQFNKTFSWK